MALITRVSRLFRADLHAVLDELKGIEKKLLKLRVPKEARRLLFQLVEMLDAP